MVLCTALAIVSTTVAAPGLFVNGKKYVFIIIIIKIMKFSFFHKIRSCFRHIHCLVVSFCDTGSETNVRLTVIYMRLICITTKLTCRRR